MRDSAAASHGWDLSNMRARDLNHWITIGKLSNTVDVYGVPQLPWTVHAEVKAQVVQQSSEAFVKNYGLGVDGDHRFMASAGGGLTLSGDLALEQNWQASLRARAGVALDRLLVYGTGGVAFSEADLSFRGSAGGMALDISDSQTFTGWTIGLGSNYAFTDNLIGRLEVRYPDSVTRTSIWKAL